MSQFMRRPLEPGDRCRIAEDGAVWTVYRVTPAAAYLRRREPKPHPDPERAAQGETIQAAQIISVSRNSFVFAVQGAAEENE